MVNAGEIISGAEALDPSLQVDWIIQHPHSSNIKLEDGRIKSVLSVLSEMSVVSAGLLYARHPSSTVVFTGETCYPELAGFPDTADLILEKAKELGIIPDEKLRLLHHLADGRYLNNTYLQFEALVEFFNGQQPTDAIGSTLNYHIKRFRHTANAYGLGMANYVTAEDILYTEGVHDYDRYLPLIEKGKRIGEIVTRTMNVFDPRGVLINRRMKSKGARLGDVVEDEDGELVFEGGMAQDKLEVLQAELEQAA